MSLEKINGIDLNPEIGEYEVHENIYVQGTEIVDGKMLMSSGQWGKSFIGFFEDGIVKNKVRLADEYFAEGMTYLNGIVYLLTYKEGKVFTFKIEDDQYVKLDKEFEIEQEGWGLTNNGTEIIMSDGTDNIYYRDPKTFEILRTIKITLDGKPIDYINELEYANGYIYSNEWKTPYILKIDPDNGNIVKIFDLPEIASKSENILDENGERDPNAVLNGIAHIEGDRFYVFGKNYDYYYVRDLV